MTKNKPLHQEQLRELERLAGDKLDQLMDQFGLLDNFRKASKFYVGPCPVHGGNNKTACNIFHQGNDTVGNWRCFTHGCHNKFHPTVLGFVRGVLSHAKYGWHDKSDISKECSFPEAVAFLSKFCGTSDISNLDVDFEAFEQRKFASQINRIYAPTIPEIELKVPREAVLKSISIPDRYFISRGFSPEILTKYDVGLCMTPGKEMYMRATVPIYNTDYTHMIGCTGRSIFDTCALCGGYHNPMESCPDEYNLWKYTKWRHNDGFKGEYHLYNYWFSKEYISKSGIAIIVESPGNVWRLEEAGFHNSIATFGAHLSDGQRNILDQSGALALIVLTDPDQAGKLAAEAIRKELGKTYSIYVPPWINYDVGDTPVEQVKERLTPILDKVKRDIGI